MKQCTDTVDDTKPLLMLDLVILDSYSTTTIIMNNFLVARLFIGTTD